MPRSIYAVTLLLPLLLQQQKCDLRRYTSPEAIAPQVEQGMQSYFPNVKAHVIPEKHMIVAISCTDGVGEQLLEEMTRSMSQNRELQQRFAMLKLAEFIGGAHYSLFGLAFENGWIVYDIDGRTFSLYPMPANGAEQYRRECGLDK